MASRDGDAIPPPKNVDEITAAWMTTALQVEFPGVEVTHLHHGQVRHGSESTVRVLLNYNRRGHEARLPPTMYVKGQWTPRALKRGYAGESSEGRFYQDIAPLLPHVNVPACYFATVRPDGSAVVMEDLFARNAVLGSAGDSFKPETAYQLADQLAQLHSLRLDSSELLGLDWVVESSDSAMDLERMAEEETGIFGSFKQWWWERRTKFDYNGFLPPELLDRRTVNRALLNKYALEDQGPKCVVHGDPHLGNMFFDLDGSPGLYDWSTGIGRWGNDLHYAIVGSLEVEDRRQHEQPILHHYLDRLGAYGGPAIPWDEAWLSWRRQTIHGFMYMLCSPRQQPEDLIRIQTIRFGWDAIDNDMLDSLGI